MYLLIDNYDSFSYNLYQLAASFDVEIKVVRNDEVTIEEVIALAPEAILISPGPGRPEDAGIIVPLIRALDGKIPILGVCLGHQALTLALGGKVGYARKLMHGKSSLVRIDRSSPIFRGLDEEIEVARYHSLSAVPSSLEGKAKVIAMADDGEVMAIESPSRLSFGLQFHPESILTPKGREIMKNCFEYFQEVSR